MTTVRKYGASGSGQESSSSEPNRQHMQRKLLKLQALLASFRLARIVVQWSYPPARDLGCSVQLVSIGVSSRSSF